MAEMIIKIVSKNPIQKNNLLMKKHIAFLLSISLLFLFTSFGNSKPRLVGKEKVTYVWICVGESAYVYHLNKECHGLNRCKHERRHVTRQEAIDKYKRRLCGHED
jgi:hypothetical protein